MSDDVLDACSVAGSFRKPARLVEPETLWATWRLLDDALAAGRRAATLIWVTEQDSGGLDIVCEGEQSRKRFAHGFL